MKLKAPSVTGGFDGKLDGQLAIEKPPVPKLVTAAEQGNAGTARSMGGVKPPAPFAKQLGLDPTKNLQKPMLQKLQFHPNASIASAAKKLLGQF